MRLHRYKWFWCSGVIILRYKLNEVVSLGLVYMIIFNIIKVIEVGQVIVAEQDFIDTLGGEWVQNHTTQEKVYWW